MPGTNTRSTRRAGLLTALVLLALGGSRLAPGAAPAAAAVSHRSGYHATVDGFTSWYGSYDMGSIGAAWCVDHGIRAPDPALGYVPSDLPGTSDATRAALAWAVGRYGVEPDRPTAAALMLVAHDLMGAWYPSGDLDVDRIDTGRLAGFGGDEAAVLARARGIKADALSHAAIRPPWLLELGADDPAPGQPGNLTARVTAAGQPVGGITLQATATGTTFGGAAVVTITTGGDGTAAVGFVAVDGPYHLEVGALVPDLTLQAFAPTGARAQRVARAAILPLHGVIERVGVLPTTTTTSTTTTAPATTTTSTTSTTAPATTTTSTTSTTMPATTTTSAAEAAPFAASSTPASVPAAAASVVASGPTALPRTGADPVALGCVGAGFVLLGASLRPRRGLTTTTDHP